MTTPLTNGFSMLEKNFEAESRKMKTYYENLQIVLVFQNPRQFALEVVSERYDLPDSNEYIEILSEWVIVSILT
jgi:hypothetical protein